jgi:hypothetical protein
MKLVSVLCCGFLLACSHRAPASAAGPSSDEIQRVRGVDNLPPGLGQDGFRVAQTTAQQEEDDGLAPEDPEDIESPLEDAGVPDDADMPVDYVGGDDDADTDDEDEDEDTDEDEEDEEPDAGTGEDAG